MKRRHVLQALISTPCLAGAWPLNLRADSIVPTLHTLTDRMSLITGAGGNVVVHKGATGLTLIDSGLPGNVTLQALIDELAGSAPVHTLFNTHWHVDHSGGNEAMRARGAQIYAHVNTKLWLTADFDVHWREARHRPRPAEALPDVTFHTDGEHDLGDETMTWHHYPQAHTDGDIVLYFPASNVLVAGGLLTDGRYPICDIATGGWIGGLIAANAAMLELVDDDTILIPHSGLPRSKADLAAQHAMLEDLYTKMKALAQDGYNGQDMLDAKVTADYDEVWGDPSEFLLETYRGMWAHTYDMGGFI